MRASAHILDKRDPTRRVCIFLDFGSASSHDVEEYCATVLEQLKASIFPLPFIIRTKTMPKNLTLEDLENIPVIRLNSIKDITTIDTSVLTDKHVMFIEVDTSQITNKAQMATYLGDIAKDLQAVLQPANVVILPEGAIKFSLGLLE